MYAQPFEPNVQTPVEEKQVDKAGLSLPMLNAVTMQKEQIKDKTLELYPD
jgi:hypothetical protein